MTTTTTGDLMFSSPEACWDSESRKSPFSTVADPSDDGYCEGCDGPVTYSGPSDFYGSCACCPGHPAGPSDPMGETVYCDGSCS